MKSRLNWYYLVMENKLPAKFMIAKKVFVDINALNEYSLEELWELHDTLSKDFNKLRESVYSGKLNLEELEEPHESKATYLDVKIEIAHKIIEKCELCEWKCGVNRHNKVGMCRLGTDAYVTTYFLHVGEEAPLVPSGTIFYGSCNFRCVFCQNHDISQETPFQGIKVGPRDLATIQEYLRLEGARNINHVGGEPTPNLPIILESLKHLNINVPQLWNSNMYLSEHSLKLLIDIVDIWLPDFKYGNNDCALKYSKVTRYFDVVSRNLGVICNNRDPIIIRHLVLPNHIDCCTKKVLEWIANNCKHALVNIMSQYRPEYLVLRDPRKYMEIARTPTYDEMNVAYNFAKELGISYEEVS